MKRRLIAGAVLSVFGAGIVIDDRHPSTLEAGVAPAATATPTIVASPTPVVTAAPSGLPAIRAAEAYALAATSWNAKTYITAYRRRLDLAVGLLGTELSLRHPTRAQLQQLDADRVSRLGAIVHSRSVALSSRNAQVVLEVDELQLSAGGRFRRTVRYRIDLRRALLGWRISGFTNTGETA